jgi:hypothetical protein
MAVPPEEDPSMPTFSMDELTDAYETLDRFLRALVSDDDAEVGRLFYPDSAANLVGHGGMAGRIKAAWGVTDDDIIGLGLVATARVLDDRLVAFALVAAEHRRPSFGGLEVTAGPTPARVLALIRADDDRGWQVWGTPSAEAFADPLERVPLIIPAPGPIH